MDSVALFKQAAIRNSKRSLLFLGVFLQDSMLEKAPLIGVIQWGRVGF